MCAVYFLPHSQYSRPVSNLAPRTVGLFSPLYNLFLDNVVTESLNNDGMYLGQDSKLIRISVPLVGDDEIERVVSSKK